MRVLGLPLLDCDERFLNELVTNGVAESRTLEYKEELPGNADADKREFLKDASALANTAGGVILYGVSESRDADGKPTGVPEAIVGLADANLEPHRLRLVSILRDSLAPPLTEVEFHEIELEGGGQVLGLGIPRSLRAPHAVRFRGKGWFHRRSASQVYPLDVGELRAAFLEAASWVESARTFRDGRVESLFRDPETARQGVLILAIPLGREEPVIDFREDPSVFLRPPGGLEGRGIRNVDGWRNDGREGWTHLYRHGPTELLLDAAHRGESTRIGRV